MASLGLGWVGEPAVAALLQPVFESAGLPPAMLHTASFVIGFLIFSSLHIVIGELAPKSWAIRKPELLSLWTAAPLYLFYWAMYPAIYLLNASANAILRVAGQGEPGPHHEHHYSRDELKLILHSSRASDPSDQDMRVLASAVELGELEVVDWANSREDLISLPLAAALDGVFSVFRRHKYSRYPIYDDTSGEYVGVLHIKDLLLHLSLIDGDGQFGPRYLALVGNTVTLATVTACLAVPLSLLLAYGVRRYRSASVTTAVRVAGLGYAVPGSVIAVGTLIPFAMFDNAVDAWMRSAFGVSTGLLLTGTIAGVVFACLVRFLAVSLGAVEAGLGRVTPGMEMAARTLGHTPSSTLKRLHLPMIRGSLLTGALLVAATVWGAHALGGRR